jgi:hypothetical protein
MALARDVAYRVGMPAIPSTARARDLRAREDELRRRLQRCRAAAEGSARPNPSLGREADDVSAVLARVRKELASLRRD